MACFKLKHFRHQVFGRGPCRKSPTFSARARAENLLPEISNRKCAISGSARNRKILQTEKGQKKVWKSGSSRNGLRCVQIFLKNLFVVSKGFLNVTTSGRQYNIGEKPSVIIWDDNNNNCMYTYINLHAMVFNVKTTTGTPKPQSFLSKSPGLQCSNMVLEKLKLNLVNISI